MINAQELRIGNWIDVVAGNRQQVAHIRKQFVKDGDLYFINSRLPEHCIPILLTPEILEKCGAGKDEDGFLVSITTDGWELFIEETNEWDVWYGKDENRERYLPLVSIRYLHQLQNLYFCLTGTELEVKL